MTVLLKKPVLLIVLALCIGTAEAQVKNILLDPNNAYEPSVAINRKNPENIIVSAAPGNIYHTNNGGLSWTKTKLTNPYGDPASLYLLADFNGKFYCVQQAIKNGKSSIVIQESTNEGKTWSAGVMISTDTSSYATTPRAAVDRKGNLYVTWTAFDVFESKDEKCQSRVLISRSSNGKKWSKPTELSQTDGDCQNDDNTTAGATPAVMGGGERAFAVWSNQEKIVFDRAFDGITWLSNDLAINNQVGGWNLNVPGTNRANGLPTLLCNNTKKTNLTGALYVMWADNQRGENDTDVWFTRSLNFGDSWEPPSRINDDNTGRHQYLPAMTFDAETGNLYTLFYDRRNSADEATEVYLAYSTDSGTNFKNLKISETPFVSDATAPLGNFIGITAHGGLVASVWTRAENGKSSVYVSIARHEDLEKMK